MAAINQRQFVNAHLAHVFSQPINAAKLRALGHPVPRPPVISAPVGGGTVSGGVLSRVVSATTHIFSPNPVQFTRDTQRGANNS